MRHRFSLDHVSLQVSDLARSTHFYRDVLGLTLLERAGSERSRWLSIGETETLHLIAVEAGPVDTCQQTHFALRTADFDAFVADLDARGQDYFDWAGEAGKIWLHRSGMRQVYLQDPDGHWIEVNDRVVGRAG